MSAASGHVLDLSGRLRDTEAALGDSRSRENKLQRDVEENRRRYKEAKHEISHLKGSSASLEPGLLPTLGVSLFACPVFSLFSFSLFEKCCCNSSSFQTA